MQKAPVIILGFGGNAIDFFDTVSSSYEIIGFVDDNTERHGQTYNGVKVQGRGLLDAHPNARIISLIGSEKTFKIRHEIIDKFNISPSRFATAIHPRASVSASAVIGNDVVIMPGVVITSNAKIGNHIFILANTVLHHDVEIGDYTLMGSNITVAGHVKIGRNCFIGSGTTIKNNISVGDYSITGMSANVVKTISSNACVIGNPAKSI